MSTETPAPYPPVAGHCPMGCGQTLFRAAGGHVTCSLIGCPRPTAVDELLEDRETDHVVVLRARDFTVRHPLRKRLDDELLTCDVHERISKLDGPLAQPGTYRVSVLPGGSLDVGGDPMTAAETMQKWAARLTTRQTHRAVRDDGTNERITLDPLLELLAGQIGSSHTVTGGGAAGPKSKPPLAVDALDLLREIDDLVTDACREYGLTVRHLRSPIRDFLARAVSDGAPPTLGDYATVTRLVEAIRRNGYRLAVDPDVTVPRDIVGNLRQLVPALIADSNGNPDDELLGYWAGQFAEWASKIEATVGDREEGSALIPLPIACPALACGAEKHLRVEEGETFSESALVANVHRHEVRSVNCRACGSWWQRGEALDGMVFDVLGGLLDSLPRFDQLGYELDLGYAPPLFGQHRPVQVIDVDDEPVAGESA